MVVKHFGRKCWNLFSVLLISCAFLLSGCDLLDDDYDYDTESSSSSSSSTTATSVSGTAVTSLFDSSLVRSKLTDTSSAESVTVMVYMNGSNLESDDGSATEDITEMLAAPYSSAVNVVIETCGTASWSSKYGISADHTQRWLWSESSLTLVDDSLSQLDCTEAGTLADFISWSAANYTADRYILVLWDHGGGPVYGFGYDEWVSDEDAALTLDEIQLAINTAGVTFDIIGFDACIMSCLEVCCALYDYCDYMVVSEEFEPGTGWSYEGWLTALVENPAIDTEDLAKILIDDMIASNTGSNGDTATLALIDQRAMPILFDAWTTFAYANEDSLTDCNYSQKVVKSSRAKGFFDEDDWDDYDDDYSLSDYYITDIMAVAQNIDSDESAALSSALSSAVLYYSATSDVTSLTGLSVTLPYGDDDFYSDLKTIFTNCGFDSTYVEWLGNFTSVSCSSSSDYYDYDDEWDDWDGWDDYDDDYDWSDYDCDDCDDYGWSDWDSDDYWSDSWFDDWIDSWFGDDDYWDDDDSWYDDDDWDDWDDDWDDDGWW